MKKIQRISIIKMEKDQKKKIDVIGVQKEQKTKPKSRTNI